MTNPLSILTDALGGFLGDLFYAIVATTVVLIAIYRDKIRDLYRSLYGDEESDGAVEDIDALDRQREEHDREIAELRQMAEDNAETNAAILETLEDINEKLETAEKERRVMHSRVDSVVAALRDHEQFTVTRYGDAEVIYPAPDDDDSDEADAEADS